MRKFILAIMLASLSIATSAETSLFQGTWQIHKNPVTHVSSITVNIAFAEGKLSGTIVLVNPDLTTQHLPILKPSVNQRTFSFETGEGRNTMHWSLIVDTSQKRGVLKGVAQEMIIEEKVTKTGYVF